MYYYQFLCLIFIAVLGGQVCQSEVASETVKPAAATPPGLMREVEDNSRYKTLEANATLLKLLVDDKDGVSRSEIFDMLHSQDDNPTHIDIPPFPEDSEDSKADVSAQPDSQAEFLQGADDVVDKDSAQQRLLIVRSRGEPFGTAAIIMVAVTCSVVCLAYISLVVWRRIYLKRNGLKHELLRNEENVAETRIEL